jgi:hypothetical protein
MKETNKLADAISTENLEKIREQCGLKKDDTSKDDLIKQASRWQRVGWIVDWNIEHRIPVHASDFRKICMQEGVLITLTERPKENIHLQKLNRVKFLVDQIEDISNDLKKEIRDL